MKMIVKTGFDGWLWFAAVWILRPKRGWWLGGVRKFVCKPTRRQLRDVNRDARKAYQRGREVARRRAG